MSNMTNNDGQAYSNQVKGKQGHKTKERAIRRDCHVGTTVIHFPISQGLNLLLSNNSDSWSIFARNYKRTNDFFAENETKWNMNDSQK